MKSRYFSIVGFALAINAAHSELRASSSVGSVLTDGERAELDGLWKESKQCHSSEWKRFANWDELKKIDTGPYKGNIGLFVQNIRTKRLGTSDPVPDEEIRRRIVAEVVEQVHSKSLPDPSRKVPVPEALQGQLVEALVTNINWGFPTENARIAARLVAIGILSNTPNDSEKAIEELNNGIQIIEATQHSAFADYIQLFKNIRGRLQARPGVDFEGFDEQEDKAK
jgi:hypothetical protein